MKNAKMRYMKNAKMRFAYIILIISLVAIPTYAWENGGSDSGNSSICSFRTNGLTCNPSSIYPRFGMHDFLLQKAISLLPASEQSKIDWTSASYGTELPDYNPPGNNSNNTIDCPLCIGDKGNHVFYYDPINKNIINDKAAIRSQEEYILAKNYLQQGDIYNFSIRIGTMSHYMIDQAQFGHTLQNANSTEHGLYEIYTEAHFQPRGSNPGIYDGIIATTIANANTLDAYNGTALLAYDTTFDISGKGHTNQWMNDPNNFNICNGNWNIGNGAVCDTPFLTRSKESVNYGVNILADVISNLINSPSLPTQPSINTTPIVPIAADSPSTITFGVTADQLVNVVWQFDGLTDQQNLSVTNSSYTKTAYVGKHNVLVNVSNQSYPGAYSSYQWIWNVTGNFAIAGDTPSINVGTPTNITFTVTRVCGIVQGENCSVKSIYPVQGAKINLNGSNVTVSGTDITDANGSVVLTVNVADQGTVRATATEYLYNSNYIVITAGIPTPPPRSSGGGGGGGSSSGGGGGSSGGGGGGGTAEPYDNILKYETQENYVTMNSTPFKYVTPELGAYEVDITGLQNGDASLRIEVLKDTSKLVGSPASSLVYKNINMWIDFKRVQNATIQYKVENSWIDSNKISADIIKMLRWDNTTKKWNELDTTITGKDGTYTYFESQTPGFSSFAISGSNGVISAQSTNLSDDQRVAPGLGNTPGAGPTVIGKKNVSIQFEIIIAIIIILLIAYTIKMKKQS